MNGLAQAVEHIAEQDKEIAKLNALVEHHGKQREIDSNLIEQLEKEPRVEIDNGVTVTRLTAEQHRDLLAKANTDLTVKIKGLENDLDVAQEYNKQLQAQLEDLKPDSLLAEQDAGLQAAENHRAGMEKEIGLLTSTVSDLEVKNSALRNDMRDLKHQPAFEERAVG